MACIGVSGGVIAGVSCRCQADFPKPFNSETASEDTQMPADQAAAKTIVPQGFRVTAFAAEPDVQNPIACDWDAKGRLWVAENYTYAEREQRFQLDLRDRVVIFDGTDQDKFTKRTVFTENASMLTGIAVGRLGGRRGVYLMCPPQLLFVPDDDQDDVPDDAGEVVLDGFTVARTNYHTFANGVRFGPDGWLYGRCGSTSPALIGKPGTPNDRRVTLSGGMWRFHPDHGTVETLCAGTTNPWGHDFNAVGDGFFVNTVNGHFWNLIHGAHYVRPFNLDPNRQTYQMIDTHADHWHFDTGGQWHESRDGVANQFGGGHAHCGLMIYQGGHWPEEYHGSAFTLNLHGQRVNREILRREGSGYIASHGEDPFVFADPWFRGMEITCGPDGNAFVLDWNDTGECHEHSGVHRTSGRIYKIAWTGRQDEPGDDRRSELTWFAKASEFNFATASAVQLVQSLHHSNSWHRRQACIELARRSRSGDKDSAAAVAALTAAIKQSGAAAVVSQAVLMAHAMGRSIKLFDHADPSVRSASIRVMTDRWPLDDAAGRRWRQSQDWTDQDGQLLSELCQVAANDSSLPVLKSLASVLQRLPVDLRAELASQLCQRQVAQGDHNLPLLIWYGLTPVARQRPKDLLPVAATCRLTLTLRLISRSLAEQQWDHPELVDGLLADCLARQDADALHAVLGGLADGLRGQRSAPRPSVWDRVIQQSAAGVQPLVRELSVVFGDGNMIAELVDVALGKTSTDYEVRTKALQSLIQADAPGVNEICRKLLKDSKINVVAARGLAKGDDSAIGPTLLRHYRNFRPADRPELISVLVSRKSLAMPLLAAIQQGTIPRSDVTPFHARQLFGMNDAELSQRVTKVWGVINDTPQAIQRRIAELKDLLSDDYLGAADKSAGRVLFAAHCQSCHKLYGRGKAIGPDLTGTGRHNLDYLLGNIVNPSGVVDQAFAMTLVLTDDGRILSGLVTGENDRVLTLQTSTELQTIEKEIIVRRTRTEKSPMPDGLLDQMKDHQVRDLIGYLRHPSQVDLPHR